MWAAGQGQAEVLRTLLEHGSDVLLYDKTGSTALHIAAARGHIECIYILIQVCMHLYSQYGVWILVLQGWQQKWGGAAVTSL